MATQLTVANSNIRPDLAEVMLPIDVEEQIRGLVGLQIFPVFESETQGGEYFFQPTKSIITNVPDTRRGADGSFPTINGEVSKKSFSCSEHGLSERVEDREQAMYGSFFDCEEMAAQRVVLSNLRKHTERVVAALDAANLAEEAAAAVWSNASTAAPIDDIDDASVDMRNTYGIRPNALCMEWEAFIRVRRCAQVLEAVFGSTNPERADSITPQILAQIFDLREVIISDSQKNSANEGQDAVLATVWDRTKALLFRKSTERNLRLPQLGRTFHWKRYGSVIGRTFESWYSEERTSAMVRQRMDVDENVCYAPAGTWITGVLS